MDLLLDTDNHDVVFEGTDISLTTDRTNVVAQRLKIRLRTFLGEWRYNTAYGVPYYQQILGIKNSKEDVDTVFQLEILKEPGVRNISSFESTYKDKVYTLSFRAKVDTGELTELIEISPGA